MAECATVMDKAVAELKELFASEVKKKGEEEGFLMKVKHINVLTVNTNTH